MTSMVPSPPSAIGRTWTTASLATERMPTESASAASRADTVPLNESGAHETVGGLLMVCFFQPGSEGHFDSLRVAPATLTALLRADDRA